MTRTVPLGALLALARVVRAGEERPPILSMTMRDGLVDQSEKFKKQVASRDLSSYKVVRHGQLVVGFPIDEGVLAFQRRHDAGLVSPAYGIWDLTSDNTDPRYLERFLRSPRALAYYRARLKGTTARRRSLSQSDFVSMPVPLPPLDEQRRIADMLDGADALRAKRHETLARLDELTQSIFVDMFGDPTAIGNASADLAPLSDLVDVIRGVTFKPADVLPSVAADDAVACLTTKHVQSRLVLDAATPIPAAVVKRDEQYLQVGDVLMSTANSANLVGKTCLVDRLSGPTTLGGFITALRPRSGISSAYLAALLSGATMRQKLCGLARQTTNIANIDIPRLKAMRVPCPPWHSQDVFEQRVKSIETLRHRSELAVATLDILFASLQQRAFRGDLFSGDLPDELADAA